MRIEYGYDRSVRAWNVVVIDDEGNIIESSYEGNVKDAIFEANYFSDMYNINEIKKIKSY